MAEFLSDSVEMIILCLFVVAILFKASQFGFDVYRLFFRHLNVIIVKPIRLWFEHAGLLIPSEKLFSHKLFSRQLFFQSSLVNISIQLPFLGLHLEVHLNLLIECSGHLGSRQPPLIKFSIINIIDIPHGWR